MDHSSEKKNKKKFPEKIKIPEFRAPSLSEAQESATNQWRKDEAELEAKNRKKIYNLEILIKNTTFTKHELAQLGAVLTEKSKQVDQKCTEFYESFIAKYMEPPSFKTPQPQLPSSVLKEVFTYLDEADLLSCRLVCQSWWESATEALRQNHTLGFYRYVPPARKSLPSYHYRPPPPPKPRAYDGYNKKWGELSKFTELMRTTRSHPYTSVRFMGASEWEHWEDLKNMNQFFQVMGRFIEELSWKVGKELVSNSDKLVQQVFPGVVFPKLKKLAIKYDRSDSPPGLNNLMKTILSISPKLEHLDYEWNINSSLLFKTLSQESYLSNLVRLDLLSVAVYGLKDHAGNPIEKVLDLDLLCGFKLKCLSFNVRTWSPNQSTKMLKFLESQAPTLENLKLFPEWPYDFYDKSLRFACTFPPMEILKDLTLHSSSAEEELELNFDTFIDYPTAFPNLEVLRIQENWNDKLFSEKSGVHLKLRKLELPRKFMKHLDKFSAQIARIFPNLSTLKLHKMTAERTTICLLFPKLTQLIFGFGKRKQDKSVADRDRDRKLNISKVKKTDPLRIMKKAKDRFARTLDENSFELLKFNLKGVPWISLQTKIYESKKGVYETHTRTNDTQVFLREIFIEMPLEKIYNAKTEQLKRKVKKNDNKSVQTGELDEDESESSATATESSSGGETTDSDDD